MNNSKSKKKHKTLAAVKSVPKPSAQTSVSCELENTIKSHSDTVFKHIAIESCLPVPEKAIIELMYLSGCRISEALNIKASDIMRDGRIKVGGSKNSNPVIISPVLYRNYWLRNKMYIESSHSVYSRFYFYRLFNKLGLVLIFNSSNKKAVTHSLRHIYIKSLSLGNVQDDVIQKAIGHKKITSQKHYKKT